MNRTILAIKAIRQLGFKQSALFFLYRMGLASGFFGLSLTRGDETKVINDDVFRIEKLFDLPSKEILFSCLSQQDMEQTFTDGDEILANKVRLFGGAPVDLVLKPALPLSHWTAYETGKVNLSGDVKMIWEPARFGWAYTLARAFYISGDEKYARAFWRLTEAFLESNPPYLGPQWMSAQEAALRLISLAFAAQVFAGSKATNAERMTKLGKAIANHAKRIPPTLIYARAQNNNHLLSEAAGLITAALALPRHPQTRQWLKMGWRWFNRGLEGQINEEGVYIQQSANYQRLILQLALWIHLISQHQPKGKNPGDERIVKQGISGANRNRLKSATHWLLAMLDDESGQCPNLGPNDGAYIQPLSGCPFADYRPVLQACSIVFLGTPAFGKGAWDEMGLWYGVQAQSNEGLKIRGKSKEIISPHVLKNPISQSWAYLRIANFRGRPGHADQLHLDIWREEINIAQDAGTFSYNSPFPWDNALAKTAVHNTVTVNDLDQMTRSGKFLWLDWAQAKLVNTGRTDGDCFSSISAEHDGYKKLGILHRRCVSTQYDGSWLIEDQLLPGKSSYQFNRDFSFRVHWLLCDVPWEWGDGNLTLFTKIGIATVQIHSEKPIVQYQLVRAGELLAGEGEISPTWGWVSPTYAQKEPALSLSIALMAKPPVEITTQITFHNY